MCATKGGEGNKGGFVIELMIIRMMVNLPSNLLGNGGCKWT